MRRAIMPNLARASHWSDHWVLAIIVVFVAGLGIGPHLRFSTSLGEVLFLKGAYDEDTYFLFLIRNLYQAYRLVSHYTIFLIYKLSGDSANFTLITADFLLPAMTATSAYFLSVQIARSWYLRLLLTLTLVFGQDIFSLANTVVWPDRAPPIESFRALFGDWGATLIPSAGATYIALFRTPEPQVSYTIVFCALAVLVRIAKRDAVRTDWIALSFLSLTLPFAFILVSLPVLAAEAWLALVLFWRGRAQSAAALLGIVAAVSVVFAITVLTGPAAQASMFPSRLPILTPGLLAAAIMIVPLIIFALRWPVDEAFLLGLGLLALPVLISNQQLVTGLMISGRDWERYINYPLLFAGLGLIIRFLFGHSVRRPNRPLAAFSLLSVCLIAALVSRGQSKSYRDWYPINLSSVAIARAISPLVASSTSPPPFRIALSEPGLTPLVIVRMAKPLEFVLDYTNTFLRQTPYLNASGMPADRPHQDALFEHWWRTGVTPSEAESILRREASQRDGYFLAFLFNSRDFSHAQTDNRMVHETEVTNDISNIIQAYVAFLAAPEVPSGPVLLVTSVDLTRSAAPVGLSQKLVNSGRAGDLVFFAYLQESIGSSAP